MHTFWLQCLQNCRIWVLSVYRRVSAIKNVPKHSSIGAQWCKRPIIAIATHIFIAFELESEKLVFYHRRAGDTLERLSIVNCQHESALLRRWSAINKVLCTESQIKNPSIKFAIEKLRYSKGKRDRNWFQLADKRENVLKYGNRRLSGHFRDFLAAAVGWIIRRRSKLTAKTDATLWFMDETISIGSLSLLAKLHKCFDKHFRWRRGHCHDTFTD